ncbi:MAG: hypothetical protein GKS05_00755 [Nitrospirales bacterium]|nr:hypothetical protein [Nitrospirales bacterium]
MDQTLDKPAIETIDTAILLTSAGVFDAEGRTSLEKGPLTRVGGVTLFERTLMTLQRGGIAQVLILVGEEEQALRHLLKQDARIHMTIRWLPIREFPPLQPQTWKTVATGISGSCIVLGCQMVCTPLLIRRLQEKGQGGRAVVMVGKTCAGRGVPNPGVFIPPRGISQRLSQRVVFHDYKGISSSESCPQPDSMPAADLVVLPARLLGISGSWNIPSVSPLRLALEQAAAEETIHAILVEPSEYVDARGVCGLQSAECALLQSLQTVEGGLNGWVDRYFNRKVSGCLTRLFIRFRFTPNMITMLSLMIGLGSAGCFGWGSYQMGLLGALLFQLSVIVDCCDGEVARITFSESSFGQELDIMADNIVHIAIFAGIAWGSFVQGVWSASLLPLVFGGIAMAANGLSFWGVQRVRFLQAKPLRWSRIPEWAQTRLEWLLSKVANRDFSIVVMVCAIFSLLPWFLFLSAIGASLFAVILHWTLRRARLASV